MPFLQNTTRKGMERDLGLLHMLQKSCGHKRKKKRSIKIVWFVKSNLNPSSPFNLLLHSISYFSLLLQTHNTISFIIFKNEEKFTKPRSNKNH
jgi:hypothetical protein